MRIHSRICALFVVLAVTAGAQVRTDSGLVAGVAGKDGSVVAYKGIPYAAPPVGDLRWRAPRPPASWQGVRKAEKMGPSCMQTLTGKSFPLTEEYFPQNEVSEDCLYLNVWAGSKAAGAKRPVLVWLHGGGSSEGSSAPAIYDGEGLAKKGLVVVTLNFRLAQFGFFTHPELRKESEHNASGNYGYMDILTALTWVQKNIAAFGGDPARVTIGGTAWGTAVVQALTVSPVFKGLFQRAILEGSAGFGAGNSGGARTPEEAEQDGLNYAKARGGKSLAELRAMSVEELRKSSGPLIRFGPVIDGWMFTESPQSAFNAGKRSDIPTLTGSVMSGTMPNESADLSPADWQKQIRARYADAADAFFKLYPSNSAEEALAARKNSNRDQSLIPMLAWGKTRSKTAKTNAFTYYFTHAQPGEYKEKYGVFSRSEEPYFFNNLAVLNRPWDAEDRKLADIMSSYWVNFAATGDPNGKGLPKWPAFNDQTSQTMELGDKLAPRPFGDDAKIQFFTKNGNGAQQR